ncbi:GSCOCG00007437001-RA-CDS, partial [Cotesia congregata]
INSYSRPGVRLRIVASVIFFDGIFIVFHSVVSVGARGGTFKTISSASATTVAASLLAAH